MQNMKVAVGYARTSGTINPKTSIPNQLETIRKYCTEQSIILKRIFVDEQKTGTRVEGRNSYLELKSLVEEEAIDYIIVSFFDRFARDSFEFISTIMSFIRKGIHIISVSEDSSSITMSPLQLALMGIQVELENQQRTKRLAQAKDGKIRNGQFASGAKAPFGYWKDEQQFLHVNEQEAKMVDWIFREYESGKNLEDIRSVVNQKYKKNWASTNIGRILENKTYTGYIYKKSILQEGNEQKLEYEQLSEVPHPAIISLDLFERVRIKRETKKQKKTKNHLYLVQGVFLCPGCGEVMKCKLKKYYCDGKQCSTYNQELVDQKVVEYLMGIGEKAVVKEQDQIQYNNIMKEKENLEVKFAKGYLTQRKFKEKMAAILVLLEELNIELLPNPVENQRRFYRKLIDQNMLGELQKEFKKNGLYLTLDQHENVIEIEKQH